MTKIKICGLYRGIDIAYCNMAMPDYIGFIIDYPKSHRSITKEQARELQKMLNPKIKVVGVFVNKPAKMIQKMCEEGSINIVQLHGDEDDEYIKKLRVLIPTIEIWKAFKVHSLEDIKAAELSIADRVLFDSGYGTGESFDWKLIKGFKKPIILAGGLTPTLIAKAIHRIHPWAIDISTGVESKGYKDKEKISAAVIATKKG